MAHAQSSDLEHGVDATFVGRSGELDAFRAAFDRMLAGRRQIVTLVGEPGIGKTRCAEAFARVAEDRGALVLWGRCYEEPGAPPYWPWVQIVREHIGMSSPDERRLLAGPGLNDLAAIVPELGGTGAAATGGGGADPAQARFLAFDAFGRLFARAAQQTPLVCVLDNLHWADGPSLSLLEFLSDALAHSPVLFLGTYRDNEVSRKNPLQTTLGGLSHESGFERLRLQGLAKDAIAELATRMLGAALSCDAVDAIDAQTDGNPLFVVELLKALMEEAADSNGEPIAVRIPDGVRETLGRRLSRLTERCNALLAVASVLGRRFTARELASAAHEALEIVLEELDAADRAGIVDACADEHSSYQFAHALIRETLYEEIPHLDRLKLHGRVADALAALYGTESAAALSRLAHHYYESAPLGNAEKAADLALQAAENAARIYAYEETVAHCDRVAGALALANLENEPRVAKAYLLKGYALTVLRSQPEAADPLLRAVKHALKVGDAELLAEAATLLVRTMSFGPQLHTAPLLARALALLPTSDSAARARALAALAFALRTTSDGAQIPALIEEALAVAGRLDDPVAQSFCLQMSIMALRGRPDSLPRRIELGERHLKVARRSGSDELLVDACCWQVLNRLEAGEIDAAEAVLARYERLPVARFGIYHYKAATSRIQIALLRGEWSGLEERIDRLLEAGLKTRPRDAEGVHSAQMFVLNRDLGRLRTLEPIVRRFASAGSEHTWAPGLLIFCAELGLVDDARRVLERLATDEFGGVPRDDTQLASLVFCAEACCKLGDAQRARILYDRLAPHAAEIVYQPRAVCLGAAALYLGMLARTIGDPDTAAEHFEAALASHREMNAWPWLARTQFQYGALLVALEDGDTQARGRELLHNAEQLAGRLGMTALIEEIGGPSRGAKGLADFPDGLTAREVEVLRLLAIGRSNKDISTVLEISLNTVATHVRSILTKTHCANRTEAAAYAIRHGLDASGATRT